MEHEPAETVCKNTLSAFQHLRYSSGHVVKAQPDGNTTYSLKYPLHTFQKALLVLRRKCLSVTLIGIWKGNSKRVGLPLCSGNIVVDEFTEVYLTAAFRLRQGKITIVGHLHDELLLADITFNTGVTAGKAKLIPQTVIDPLRCVPLLSGNLAVLREPLVYNRNEFAQYRITLRLYIR